MSSQMSELTPKEAKAIVDSAPVFIKDAIDQTETMYCPRTGMYAIRGQHFATMQYEQGEDSFVSTLNYHSSFYDEYIYLSALKYLYEQAE